MAGWDLIDLGDSIISDFSSMEQESPAAGACSEPMASQELPVQEIPLRDGFLLGENSLKSQTLLPLIHNTSAPWSLECQEELPVLDGVERELQLEVTPSAQGGAEYLPRFEFSILPLDGDDNHVLLPRAQGTSIAEQNVPCGSLLADKSLEVPHCGGSMGDRGADCHHPESHSTYRRRRRYEEEPSVNPDVERSRRNAVTAKRNREKKKHQLETLETSVHDLMSENGRLFEENSRIKRKVESLENENSGLKSAYISSNLFSGTPFADGGSLLLAPDDFRRTEVVGSADKR